jgi:hypothetical protein
VGGESTTTVAECAVRVRRLAPRGTTVVRDVLGYLSGLTLSRPRIDPAALPTVPGLQVHGWVPDLYRHLAACDVAITHGGSRPRWS